MSPHRATSLLRACPLAAALALVACTADASRDRLTPTGPALSAANRALPFRGTLETRQKSVVPLGATTAQFVAEGTGTATYLGLYTIVSALTLDFATLTGTEDLTLTAANGDVLTATATAQGFPNADGVTVKVVESATITGGTGRFVGATGSYVVRCVVNQATSVSTGSFDGSITLVK